MKDTIHDIKNGELRKRNHKFYFHDPGIVLLNDQWKFLSKVRVVEQ